MKKLLAILAVLGMLAVLPACINQEEVADDAANTEVADELESDVTPDEVVVDDAEEGEEVEEEAAE
jgi:hypothetical protein